MLGLLGELWRWQVLGREEMLEGGVVFHTSRLGATNPLPLLAFLLCCSLPVLFSSANY